MFHAIDLFSRRRKAKLAPSWLAATSSEKLFKRHYNSAAIEKINIIKTCEEILRTNGEKRRFSLYLSSQLMYGITKIYSYQVTCYEKELTEIWQKLDITLKRPPLSKRKEKDFDMVEGLEFPIELPLISSQDLSVQLNEDLHILPGESVDGKFQMFMKDAEKNLYFGGLTNADLDIMHERDGDIVFEMREMRITDYHEGRDVVEIMDVEMDNMEIAKEIHQERFSRATPSSMDRLERRADSGERLLTIQKRQPCQPQVETPTKKRRLSVKDTAKAVSPAPLEDITVPVPVLSVEDTTLPPQQVELDMELESIHSNFFLIEKKPKKSKSKIDKSIILKDTQLKQWRDNTEAHCRQLDMSRIHHRIPAKNLLSQPSNCPTRWNASLRRFFNNKIAKLLASAERNISSAGFLQPQEAMRTREMSKPNLPVEDLSALGKTQAAITADTDIALESTTNILPMDDIKAAINEIRELSVATLEVAPDDAIALEEGIGVERGSDQKKTADLNDTDTIDIEILLKKQQRPSKTKDHISESSTSSARISQPAPLTKREILALLSTLWDKQECIKFSDLISSESYSKMDVNDAFLILLELQAEKVVVLQQAECYDTLWIRKYETYSE